MRSIKKTNLSFKKKGISLIELIVATTIGGIVMLSVLSTIGGIYFSQKKVRSAQNFYSETRVVMEKMARVIRDNTIDYDRYFIEVGPPTANCGSFDSGQGAYSGSTNNDRAVRIAEGGYSNIFYWKLTGDIVRNLGGKNNASPPLDDPCAQAFADGGVQSNLYLINGNRNLRTNIHADLVEKRIKISRQLGADTDGDGYADKWGPAGTGIATDGDDTNIALVWNAGTCEVHWSDNSGSVVETPILGDSANEDLCRRGHLEVEISPEPMEIVALDFFPAPNRDPFLNFRVDSAQVHPHVFMKLQNTMRDPTKFGFTETNKPIIDLQTTVSSRVFGDIRK